MENYIIKGEPEIVSEVRKRVLDEFADLEFFEDGHIYLLHGKQLPSVSGIGHRFERFPFNSEKQAEKYALRHGRTAAYWLREWKLNSLRATTLGTKTHEFGESMGYIRSGLTDMIVPRILPQYYKEENYLAPIHPKEEAVLKFFNDLPESYHLVLNETKVYSGKNPDSEKNLKEQICGTFDMLYYNDGTENPDDRGFEILDYKTNGSLENDFNRKIGRTLLPPFDDLIEEEMNLYAIQLSLYALMLEDIGVNVTKRKLVWLKEDGTYEIRPLPDLSDRLRKVL